MIANKKMHFPLRPLASGIKMTTLLPAPPAMKLKPAIPRESSDLGPTIFVACDHNGVKPTTRRRRTHACRSQQPSCPMTSALHVDCCFAHKHHRSFAKNCSLVALGRIAGRSPTNPVRPSGTPKKRKLRATHFQVFFPHSNHRGKNKVLAPKEGKSPTYANPLGECLPGARTARYLSINYPDFSPRFTLSWRSPPSRPRCTAHLPYKARCIIKQYM